MIYTCKKVYLCDKTNEEKVARLSFFLEDVSDWEEYVADKFVDFGPKTFISRGDKYDIILVDWADFDSLMKKEPSKIGHNIN